MHIPQILTKKKFIITFPAQVARGVLVADSKKKDIKSLILEPDGEEGNKIFDSAFCTIL